VIPLTELRTLTLREASRPGRPAHVSAASGLVRVRDRLYVIADDENHIAVFGAEDDEPGGLARIFAGTLPLERKARKRNKADVEAIAKLPPFEGHAHGALFTMGSGSTGARCSGVVLGLDASGALDGTRAEIQLTALYARIEERFGKPNTEGAVVLGDELLLLQRGNKGDRRNARLHLDLAAAIEALATRQTLGADLLGAIEPIDLGRAGDIPICFTDGAALDDGRMLFTAIAEDTRDAYEDGACQAARIGILRDDGKLDWMEEVDPRHKVEGIDATLENGVLRALLVTDADDAEVPATLLACEVALTRG